jgi:hypothetical protein
MITVQISDDVISQARAKVKAILQERVPNMDLRRGGPMNDLLLNGVALGLALVEQRISEFATTQSLLNAQQAGVDWTTIDPTVIDAILSNWFITRKEGGYSRGLVQVIVSYNKLYFVPKDFQFTTVDGTAYITETAFTVQYPSDTTPADSIPLRDYDTANGLYFFTIPVVALNVGLNDISAGTALSVPIAFDNKYLSASAYSNFSGGAAPETTEALIARSKDAITLRNNLSKKAISANLKDQFPTITDIGIIGYGDREQLRDLTSGLNVHLGGKVDIFPRTGTYPTVAIIDRTFDNSGKIVLSPFGPNTDPSPIYQVKGVFLTSEADKYLNYSDVTLDTDAFTVTREPLTEFFTIANVPDVTLAPLATAFSPLEQITIQATDVATYANQSMTLVLSGLFGVMDIYNFVISDTNRVIAADQLVRAPIPCFVTVPLKYAMDNTGTVIDTAALTQAIQDYINSIPMGSELYVSKIIDLAHSAGVSKVKLPLTVTGSILAPDGSTISLSSSDSLVVPNRFSLGMSAKNTAFFIDQNSITLTEVNL